MKNQEIRLAAHPVGMPKAEDFEIATDTSVPEPGPGQVLIDNLYITVEPFIRGRIKNRRNLQITPPHLEDERMPMVEVGDVVYGASVGRVLASRDPRYCEGELVMVMGPWRRYCALAADRIATKLPPTDRPSAYLGALGFPGFSAYAGILEVGALKPGEVVYVSAAAGAVGHIAGQIAKLKGCTVVGSTSSPAKAELLVERYGFDHVINYRTQSLKDELHRLCPQGVDVCFDNVGGPALDAALFNLKPFGRVVACGAISSYNDDLPEQKLRYLWVIVRKRITVRGFVILDYVKSHHAQFMEEMSAWLETGAVVGHETIYEGLEQLPAAFRDALSGRTMGKTLVRCA